MRIPSDKLCAYTFGVCFWTAMIGIFVRGNSSLRQEDTDFHYNKPKEMVFLTWIAKMVHPFKMEFGLKPGDYLELQINLASS